MQILLSAITKEFREKFSAFSRNCWFGGVVVQQQAVAAAIPNIRIFSRPISQRIQFSKYHLHTTLAAAKVISTFPVSCFSDDKIVDNAFVFSGPFYFNCPIGHVIQKLDMFVHKIWIDWSKSTGKGNLQQFKWLWDLKAVCGIKVRIGKTMYCFSWKMLGSFFINFTFLILTDPLFELSFDYQAIWDHFEPWQEVRRRLKCIFEREPPDWSRSSNVGSIFPCQWTQLRPQTQFSEVFKIGDLISAAACNRSGQEFVGISGKATNIFTPAEIELESLKHI